MVSNFAAKLEEAILIQQLDGLVCPTCGKTRVEHYFKKSQTCGTLEGFADKNKPPER